MKSSYSSLAVMVVFCLVVAAGLLALGLLLSIPFGPPEDF